MLNNIQSTVVNSSLLTIIVDRGKGSKILQFASSHGLSEATGLLGRGTIKNELLKLIFMNEVEKEIILIVVPSDIEQSFLHELNMKFHFDKPNHGIAFTMPLIGLLKLKSEAVFKKYDTINYEQNPAKYIGLFLIVDSGKAESVIEISQNAGYYGGTILKANGSVGVQNTVLDMPVEPKKDAILLITESNRAHKLADLLSNSLNLSDKNTGMLVMLEISHTIGIYKKEGIGNDYE